MSKRIVTIVAGVLLAWMLAACSGSKSATGEYAPFQDEMLQSRAEELHDQVDSNPNNLEYRRQLAQFYHENGRSLDALKVLESGLSIDPNDPETKIMYGEISEQMGDKRRALTAYKEVLQSSSGNAYLDRIAPKFVDAFKVTPLVATSANEAFGSFSADDSKIIYQADPDGNWDIFEYDMASGETKQLTKTPHHEEMPVYGPDGKSIAYTSTVEDHRNVEYFLKVRDIMIHNLEMDRVMNVTQNSADDWRPRFAHSGHFISFVSERDDLRDVDFGQLRSEVYIMEDDGRFQLRVTENESDDGNAVVAPGSTEEKGTLFYDSDEEGSYQIYKIQFDGTNKKRITFNSGVNDTAPDISKDGSKIAFFSDRDGNYEVYQMNADGSEQIRLTSNPADDLNPVFSGDATKVLFHSDRGGNYNLYLLDLTQSSAQPTVSDVIASIDAALSGL